MPISVLGVSGSGLIRSEKAYDRPVNRVPGGNKQQGYDDTARAC